MFFFAIHKNKIEYQYDPKFGARLRKKSLSHIFHFIEKHIFKKEYIYIYNGYKD